MVAVNAMCRDKVRTRRPGCNRLSDKYRESVALEPTLHRDMATFLATTGFTNIRRSQRCSTNLTVHTVAEVERGLVLGYAQLNLQIRSLETAWRLVAQDSDGAASLVYIVEDGCFFLCVQRLSETTHAILTDRDEDEDPQHTTYQAPAVPITVDSFIMRQIIRQLQITFDDAYSPAPDGVSVAAYFSQYGLGAVRDSLRQAINITGIYIALCTMIPMYIRHNGLSRSTISNRVKKLKMTLLSCIE